MQIKTVAISYHRKFNLGDFESIDIGCDLWASLDEDEDSEACTQFLYMQAKQAVKDAAMPVIKASEYQRMKIKQHKRVMGKPVVEDSIDEEEI
ncbi:MAG: hypothetical protein KME46_25980 [Brasilonema angustatum HA4187-MV1]|jgi:hypothetical protein|nr:hypothetical protein [Brasilonema angustatum HA4187-MV1]